MQPKPPNIPPLALQEALASTSADRRIEVLRAIERLGSISEAARASGVSYKAAWQALETLTNLAGVPLLEKSVGGSGGGGARLTDAGRQLLRVADRLNQARAQVLAQMRTETISSASAVTHLSGIGLRTSMRNQLPCIVNRIEKPGGAPRVWLDLPDGQQLSSRLTGESLELLELKVGMPVLALFKATAVTIAPTIVAVGEVNLLKGHIARGSGFKSDGQVSMAIGHGLKIAGFAEQPSSLKTRQAAMAAIAESAIVIGLDA